MSNFAEQGKGQKAEIKGGAGDNGEVVIEMRLYMFWGWFVLRRRCLLVVVLSQVLFFGSLLYADFPRKRLSSPGPVSHEEAERILNRPSGIVPRSAGGVASETEVTPEIKELAKALQHDPLLIYQYVYNHIDYVPTYGSLKGASMTLLERCGNDFD